MQWDKSERNTSEKSTLQTSPNWRENLPRLEGALFQGLGAWRIIFFYFRNHFLKIHTQRIPKMSDFSVLSHFWLRNWLSKKKKRVLTPSFPQPTSNSKWVGEPDYTFPYIVWFLLYKHNQCLILIHFCVFIVFLVFPVCFSISSIFQHIAFYTMPSLVPQPTCYWKSDGDPVYTLNHFVHKVVF